MMPDV